MNSDSVTFTGDNADAIEGNVKDEVRFTVVGRITGKSVYEPYDMQSVGSPGEKPTKSKKEQSKVTISDLSVEECCMDEGEEEEVEEMEDTENPMIPKAVKAITKG